MQSFMKPFSVKLQEFMGLTYASACTLSFLSAWTMGCQKKQPQPTSERYEAVTLDSICRTKTP